MVLLVLLFVCLSALPGHTEKIYHNQFAVKIPHGHDVANQVAELHGFVNIGQVG